MSYNEPKPPMNILMGKILKFLVSDLPGLNLEGRAEKIYSLITKENLILKENYEDLHLLYLKLKAFGKGK